MSADFLLCFKIWQRPGRSDGHGLAQLKISWHDWRKIKGNKSKQILNFKSEFYCFFSLKPASTVFPPNCRSNSRFGIKKGLGPLLSKLTTVPRRGNVSLIRASHAITALYWRLLFNHIWETKGLFKWNICLFVCLYRGQATGHGTRVD
jgi:hypothetical protein